MQAINQNGLEHYTNLTDLILNLLARSCWISMLSNIQALLMSITLEILIVFIVQFKYS